MVEGVEAAKEAKKFVESTNRDLIITDVPIQTLKDFRKLANSDQFRCKKNKGHYGYLLKTLLDHYLYRVPDGLDELNARVESIEEELNEFKALVEEEPQEKTIKLVNGKEMKLEGKK
jgi:hypothetical protein